MNYLSQAFLLERYGLRLDLKDLAEEMGMSKGAIANQISAGTFPITTYLDAHAGKRFADVLHVAAYFDLCREKAKENINE